MAYTEAQRRAARAELERRRQAREQERASQKGIGQIIKENIFGDDDDTTQNFGEKVGSFLNRGGESMTFGVIGDEADAKMHELMGGDYESRLLRNRQQEEIFERENPGAALTADVGGALIGAYTPMKALGVLGRGATLPATVGNVGTLGRGAGMVPRIAASTAAGSGAGATYGFMEGEGLEDRLAGAKFGSAVGAAGGAVAPIAGAGTQRLYDKYVGNKALRMAARNAPTTEQQKNIARALYRQVDNSGVEIRGDVYSNFMRGLDDKLAAQGLDNMPGQSVLTPKAQRAMQIGQSMDDAMAGTANPGLKFSAFDRLRQHAGNAAADVNTFGKATQDSRLGGQMVEELDNFVDQLTDADLVSGDADVLRSALPKAREAWRTAIKTGMLDDALEQSGNYLSGEASAIRNRIGRILRNPKFAKNFTKAEQAALKRVVHGPMWQQFLNYAGSGLGVMGQMGLGVASSGLLGPAAPLVGVGLAAGSRKLSDMSTKSAAEIARALVANRGGGMTNLPVAPDVARQLGEALVRRTGAVVPQ